MAERARGGAVNSRRASAARVTCATRITSGLGLAIALWLATGCVLLRPGMAYAQVQDTAVTTPSAQWCDCSASSAGRVAAGERGVGLYFARSFVGGAALGFIGPVVLVAPSAGTIATTGAGAALTIANTASAGRTKPELPPSLVARLQAETPEYQEAFRLAYGDELRRRRREAALLGGIMGAGAGVGVLVWLISAAY